jgi:hypothetical protein
MQKSEPSSDVTWEVWNWCCAAYSKQGRRLSFPAGTAPANTYQWRYVTAIAKKFKEWNFDDVTAQRFIDVAVQHSKSIGTMHKGLAALHQGNLLQLCYDKLLAESNHNRTTIDMLGRMHHWVMERVGDCDPVAVMLKRETPRAPVNLAAWYCASKIDALYVALAAPCRQVIAKLEATNSNDRALLPKRTELFLLRDEFMQDADNVRRLKTIFAQELAPTCPQ